jgi:nitric oxide reductase NorD protein
MRKSAEQLYKLLEPFFFNKWVLEEVAEFILAIEPQWQDYVLGWVLSVVKTQPEIAYQYALKAGQALKVLGSDGTERWLQSSLDVYYAEGLYPAVQVIKNLDQFIQHDRQQQRGLALAEIRGVLQKFLRGLGGRALDIHPGEHYYSDTEKVFLPEIVDHFEQESDNFVYYKALAVHLWAQTRYGTWRVDVAQQLPEGANYLAAFHYLETLRLNACIARDYPGLWRQMQHLHTLSNCQIPQDNSWQSIIDRLSMPQARVDDSIKLSSEIGHRPLPNPLCYQGTIFPDRVQQVKMERLVREKDLFRLALAKIADDLGKLEDDISAGDSPANKSSDQGPRFNLNPTNEGLDDQGFEYDLQLDGISIPVEEVSSSLMASIIQDLGEVPPEYLVAAGTGSYHASLVAQENDDEVDDVWKGTYHEKGAFLYDEWDCTRHAHRKNWCALREREIHPDYNSNFVPETLHKYRGHIKSLRRTFEALRDEHKILKKQPDGENLDIDALVEAIADTRSGMEMTSRIYRKAMRAERNVVVVFMVDMSGSTKGWINTVQREALLLMSEALQTLDDRYAIYGFSGMTRKRCELFKIKTFEEPYDAEIKARIAAIEPQDYTRMGVTIRHLSNLLESVNAKTKLLITLSDGKPDDYDSYHGEYGIEDTRMALFEARQQGIHPFCITIDEQARDYLPHMYGDSNFVVINDIQKLPYRISDIYRGLTS